MLNLNFAAFTARIPIISTKIEVKIRQKTQ